MLITTDELVDFFSLKTMFNSKIKLNFWNDPVTYLTLHWGKILK